VRRGGCYGHDGDALHRFEGLGRKEAHHRWLSTVAVAQRMAPAAMTQTRGQGALRYGQRAA
jgi:hypothetical protein